jgi:hypothetical protein
MILLLIVAATMLSYAAGWLIGVPWLVPVLNALGGYPFMVPALIRGRWKTAIARMLIWAAALGFCATALAYAQPGRTARLFLNAAAYEHEMLAWIATGDGREARVRAFLPQHAAHAAVFSGVSLASGSALSMPMGAALMNYMGHYAGTLGARARSPLVALAAWHPWALVRVASFVVLGVVLAGPLLFRVTGRRWRWKGEPTAWLVLATAGLVLDVALKAGLAQLWRRLLIGIGAA